MPAAPFDGHRPDHVMGEWCKPGGLHLPVVVVSRPARGLWRRHRAIRCYECDLLIAEPPSPARVPWQVLRVLIEITLTAGLFYYRLRGVLAVIGGGVVSGFRQIARLAAMWAGAPWP